MHQRGERTTQQRGSAGRGCAAGVVGVAGLTAACWLQCSGRTTCWVGVWGILLRSGVLRAATSCSIVPWFRAGCIGSQLAAAVVCVRLMLPEGATGWCALLPALDWGWPSREGRGIRGWLGGGVGVTWSCVVAVQQQPVATAPACKFHLCSPVSNRTQGPWGAPELPLAIHLHPPAPHNTLSFRVCNPARLIPTRVHTQNRQISGRLLCLFLAPCLLPVWETWTSDILPAHPCAWPGSCCRACFS
jgi:hypothetical protein